jgi:hypothetical protein
MNKPYWRTSWGLAAFKQLSYCIGRTLNAPRMKTNNKKTMKLLQPSTLHSHQGKRSATMHKSHQQTWHARGPFEKCQRKTPRGLLRKEPILAFLFLFKTSASPRRQRTKTHACSLSLTHTHRTSVKVQLFERLQIYFMHILYSFLCIFVLFWPRFPTCIFFIYFLYLFYFEQLSLFRVNKSRLKRSPFCVSVNPTPSAFECMNLSPSRLRIS